MQKSLFSDLFDLFFCQRNGVSRIAAGKNIWHGLFVYLVVSLIVSLTVSQLTPLVKNGVELIPPEIGQLFSLRTLETARQTVPLLTVLLQLVFGPLYFLMMVAILSFVSALFGGKGGGSGLGAVMGFAYLPYLLVFLGGLWGCLTYFNTVVFLFTFTIAAGWSAWLRIAGLKEVGGFPWGRAVLVYFMPLLALLVCFILFLMLALVFLVPPFMQL